MTRYLNVEHFVEKTSSLKDSGESLRGSKYISANTDVKKEKAKADPWILWALRKTDYEIFLFKTGCDTMAKENIHCFFSWIGSKSGSCETLLNWKANIQFMLLILYCFYCKNGLG